MKTKKICVALSNRTNYSKLRGILLELKKMKDVDIKIVLSSSILLEKYGSSYKDIESDGFRINKKIDCLLMSDSHESMAKTTGISLIEHASYFGTIKPDLLLVVGDRFDIQAPVIAASMMNIPIAHVQGGETSGTIDNKIRDVVSKFSTLHFVSTEASKERLVKMDNNPEFVFNFGCPAVEYVSQIDVKENFDKKFLSKKFKRELDISENEKYLLVMVHPDTTKENDVDMEVILNAIETFNMKTFVFYPNVDANNSKILSIISKYRKNSLFYMIRHMPLKDFIHTMAHCSCMIGNSSAGIREAASFGIPVINIGDRQIGRERNSNTHDIECSYNLIKKKVSELIGFKYEKQNIYYKENCTKMISDRIIKFLENGY